MSCDGVICGAIYSGVDAVVPGASGCGALPSASPSRCTLGMLISMPLVSAGVCSGSVRKRKFREMSTFRDSRL